MQGAGAGAGAVQMLRLLKEDEMLNFHLMIPTPFRISIPHGTM